MGNVAKILIILMAVFIKVELLNIQGLSGFKFSSPFVPIYL